jgi:hypothetical protein
LIAHARPPNLRAGVTDCHNHCMNIRTISQPDLKEFVTTNYNICSYEKGCKMRKTMLDLIMTRSNR